MIDEIVAFASTINPIWLYLLVFFIAYIENLFPPFPSDVIVAFAGSVSAIGPASLPLLLIMAVGGSTIGFITMYYIGKFAGNKILETGKIKFISVKAVFTVEKWFQKYGYRLIIVNRFLAGTRAIISFFAGMSELDLKKTIILSAASALIWNMILIYLGYAVGHNIDRIGEYLAAYNKFVLSILAGVVILFIARYIYKKFRNK
ncbi:MAG: DedA family protein [Ignavibacteria bacterium]|nr:DedA family protein [Ignavibacteria bacterium]